MWQGMTPECDIVMKGFIPTIRIVATSARWAGPMQKNKAVHFFSRKRPYPDRV
jgi:hypothetical protein